jgi:hypothetical protein
MLHGIYNYSSALIYYLEAMNKGDISDVYFYSKCSKVLCKLQELQFIDIFVVQTRKDILTKSPELSAP